MRNQQLMQEGGIFTIHSQPITFGEIQEKGQKRFIVEGFISTSDRDLVNDIVTDRALDGMIEQMKSRVLKLDFEHEAFRGETAIELEINKTKIPLGKAVDFTRVKDVGNNGVKVRWELNKTWKKFDEKGNVVMNFDDIKFNIENGFYDAFSIAFIPTKTANKTLKDGTVIRLLDDMNLLNNALTGNAINPHASVTDIFMKSLDYLEKKKKNNDEDDEDEENNKKKNTHKEKIKKEDKMSEQEKKDEASQGSESESESESTDNASDESTENADAETTETEAKAEVIEVKSRLDKIEKEIAEISKAISKPIQKGLSEQAPTNEKLNAESEQKSVDEARPLDQI